MKDGQDDFQSRFPFFLMNINRNTTAVIGYRNRVIFVDNHFYMRTESSQCLVYRVIDNFIDQMVETFLADIADIHRRSFADGF